MVIAHRGASATHPENTVAAFRAAADQGADGVELDVRRTRDGALAVHHDQYLADGRPLVDVTTADLPDDVPTLAAALDACGRLAVNIEIKNWPADVDWDPIRRLAESVVELVTARGDTGHLLISAFDRATIDRVHQLDPGLATGWLTVAVPGAGELDELAAGGHTALNLHHTSITPELVTSAHDVGLEVNGWTVDDPERMRLLAEWGVDGIITNVPAVGRRVIDSARETPT
jgi:glycerophosphoryl diester phosphodiesterase